MAIHVIQAHTKYGYKKGLVIHHLDHDKMNNSLTNLVYITQSEHAKIHLKDEKGEKNPMYGKHHTEATKRKISAANKGEKHPLYGKKYKWINNGDEEKFIPLDAEIPEGFARGRLKK